jgi:hypothetical protein
MEDDMQEVRVYCYRAGSSLYGYFGFGLSPKEAIHAAKVAGASVTERNAPTKGRMHLLPKGVTHYMVDDTGGLMCRLPEGVKGKLVECTWDKVKWSPVEEPPQEKKE